MHFRWYLRYRDTRDEPGLGRRGIADHLLTPNDANYSHLKHVILRHAQLINNENTGIPRNTMPRVNH